MSFPLTSPFDPVTGDLRPNYRDAYLHGQLAPTVALQVELYLKSSAVRTGAALGRYHELAAAAQQRGSTVTAPHWVQQQLLLQPTASPAGPLRRPVVRLALGLFGALSVASAVQWVRNEPLVPAPVVAAVSRVATSATEATERLVQHFSAAPASAEMPTSNPTPARPVGPRTSLKKPKPAASPVAAATASAAPVPAEAVADSLAAATPATPVAAPTSPGVAAASTPAGTVRGHVNDAGGRPLVGATVLVKGTTQGTSTDAAGNYELPVASGATLQYGYAGYNDLLRSATLGTMNVVLQTNGAESPRKGRGATAGQ